MFAPGARGRRRRHEHDDRKPDVPEHEPDEAAGEGDHEAPDRKERPLDADAAILRRDQRSASAGTSTLRRWPRRRPKTASGAAPIDGFDYEECEHLVDDDDPDTALCGVDQTGVPWNQGFPVCQACVAVAEGRMS